MNQKHFFICFLSLFFACDTDKKQATVYLGNAQKLYEQGDYASAKSNLDSIKSLYPKQFRVLKQGLQLRRKIEIKEQENHLFFCDSLLAVRLIEAEEMKSGFLFEKDAQYDDLGKYMDKSQQVEAKIQSSYIRTIANEVGEVLFSSVYCGGRAIQHTQLRVSKADGEYTETLIIPYDGGLNYRFVDEGTTTEVVTYAKERDNGVIRFIYGNKDSVLKAEYLGKEKYAFTISAADKNALVKTVDFATILAEIEKLKKEKIKSSQRLMYLEEKLATSSDDESTYQ